MYKVGYNVNEALKFWENMSEGKKKEVIFSTHPSSTNRINDIQKVIVKLLKS